MKSDNRLDINRTIISTLYNKLPQQAVVALQQGTPGQMTWLEDPPPWLRPAYCFASVIGEQKIKLLPYLNALFCFDTETISGIGGLCSEGYD